MSCRGSPIAALVAALGVVTADDASHGTRWLHTTKSDAYHDGKTRQLDAAQYGVHQLLLQNFSRTLEAKGRELSAQFQHARPFPHVVIDNALPDAYLREFAKEFPEVSLSEGQAKHGFGRCYLPGEHKKCSLADNGITIMETPYAHGLFSLLLSQAFVSFLEDLTGIMGIISDNAFQGSGVDQTLPGGALGIHTDFHFNAWLKLTRRVNVFLYFNDDWKEEYGGHLELWSADDGPGEHGARPSPKKLKRSVLPIWNRMFVFATGDRSFHGHPMPLNTTDRNRRSVAMYYYTNGAPETEDHGGKKVPTLPRMESTLTCSGIPAGHESTTYPPCEVYKRAGTYREGMKCPDDWLVGTG